MAEESDGDEDDAPMLDAPAPPELELIENPPAPASAPLHRTAPGVRRWTALTRPKNCYLHHISATLSVVSRVGCLVCLALPCVSSSSMS